MVHTNLGFGSAQDKFYWRDDFFGDWLSDEWAYAGTATMQDAQDGGVVRVSTGSTTGDSANLTWGTTYILLLSKYVCFEARFKFTSITNLDYARAGIAGSGNNYAEFQTSGGTNWYHRTRSIAGDNFQDTGQDISTSMVIFRIESHSSHIHFHPQNNECTNSPASQYLTSNYLQVYLYLKTAEDASKSLDIDYVEVEQDR